MQTVARFKVLHALKYLSIVLIVVAITFSLFITPATASPKPQVKIIINKTNLPQSVEITVKLINFRTDEDLTKGVNIQVRCGEEGGGVCLGSVALDHKGFGSMTVTFPSRDFRGFQYFTHFSFDEPNVVSVYDYETGGDYFFVSKDFKVNQPNEADS